MAEVKVAVNLLRINTASAVQQVPSVGLSQKAKPRSSRQLHDGVAVIHTLVPHLSICLLVGVIREDAAALERLERNTRLFSIQYL